MATTITKTVKPSGGDYTSLSNWEAGQQANLVTLNEIRQAECYSMSDTAAVSIDGWTTDATRYIRIYTPVSERHDGKWNTSKYRLEVSAVFGQVFNIIANHIRIDGLQISNTGDRSSQSRGIRRNVGEANSDIRISNSIIRAAGAGTPVAGSTGFQLSGYTDYRLWNNLIYDFYTGVFLEYQNSNSHGYYLANNTAVNIVNRGFDLQVGVLPTLKAWNNLSSGNGTDYFYNSIDANSNNLSSDASSPDTGYRNRVVSFVSAATKDFHLASDDTGAKDYGTDLSANADLAFSDDIDGQTRSGTWDIGADEYVAAGGAVSLAGTLDATSSIAGIGSMDRLFAGNIASLSSLDATSSIDRNIVGVISAISDIAATANTERQINGIISAISDISGQTIVIRNIIGEIIAVSTTDGSLQIAKNLSSLISAISTVGGTLTTGDILLIGTISAISNIVGSVAINRKLEGIIGSVSTLSGDSKIERLFIGNIVSISTLSAEIKRTMQFVGTIDSISNLSGTLLEDLNEIILTANRNVFTIDKNIRTFELDKRIRKLDVDKNIRTNN